MTYDLFANAPERPGRLGCAVEIAAVMTRAIERARERGINRTEIVTRMSYHLGERISEATLNSYTSQAQDEREISLRRAMAFDAALGEDILLALYAEKLGGRRVITEAEAAFVELGRIHQQERELSERKRALQTLLKGSK